MVWIKLEEAYQWAERIRGHGAVLPTEDLPAKIKLPLMEYYVNENFSGRGIAVQLTGCMTLPTLPGVGEASYDIQVQLPDVEFLANGLVYARAHRDDGSSTLTSWFFSLEDAPFRPMNILHFRDEIKTHRFLTEHATEVNRNGLYRHVIRLKRLGFSWEAVESAFPLFDVARALNDESLLLNQMCEFSKQLTVLPSNRRDHVLRRIADRDLGCGCDLEKPEPDAAKKFGDSIAGLSGIEISRRLDILAEIDRLIEEENDAEASEAQLLDTDR